VFCRGDGFSQTIEIDAKNKDIDNIFIDLLLDKAIYIYTDRYITITNINTAVHGRLLSLR